VRSKDALCRLSRNSCCTLLSLFSHLVTFAPGTIDLHSLLQPVDGAAYTREDAEARCFKTTRGDVIRVDGSDHPICWLIRGKSPLDDIATGSTASGGGSVLGPTDEIREGESATDDCECDEQSTSTDDHGERGNNEVDENQPIDEGTEDDVV